MEQVINNEMGEQEQTKSKMYTLSEELISAISHGIGTLLSITGLVIAIIVSALHGNAYCVVSSCIFGTSLIMLYSMSTLYHSITNEKAKKVFRVLDHCSIFLLIAGTYTPFTLVSLNGQIGWTLFGVIWALAIFSTIFNSISLEKFKKINIACCLIMGWIIVFAIKPLLAVVPVNGIILLVAGGVTYSVGAILYAMKKYKYMHSIWHLFVLAASILHYFAILLYVLPIDKLI